MFAVIETGGKQYRVQPGDVIDVELLGADSGSETFDFDRVLLFGDGDDVQFGSPLLDGAKVTVALVDRVRGPKIKVFKKKRRKGYRRTRGHRQDLQRVRIDSITT